MKIVISKKFDERTLFNGQEFIVEEGKITAILGESGVGKTTLLRALAGLEEFDGEREERTLSVCFQEPRLLPFATALDNLTFVGIEKEQATKWLEWAEIADVHQKANTLSGGEKQRVSLARALAKESDLLLLDEPFSSVDTARKIRLLEKLRAYLSEEKRTTAFVTHDIDEALSAADKIILITPSGITYFSVTKEDRTTYGNSPLRAQIYEKIINTP
ncbi:MAG: ATP-binding cassette domain-containing protein [Clostridia bacterium]|nr:ATP-binding cassette domain-containing protein [Clostridia bacterium]